jgi:hypothetical protein
MPKVRTGGDKRWVNRASVATPDYVSGIQNPRTDWATATKAAEENWKQGVQHAASAGSFGKGVVKAGSGKQIAKAIGKGAQRYATGVADAQQDYANAIAPFLQVIESTVLPPRGPKGDPRNIDRVKAITVALRNKKLAA